jgi:tetratricopeptide (TPR) repeat protein
MMRRMVKESQRKSMTAGSSAARIERVESEAFRAALAIYSEGIRSLGRREWDVARAKFQEVAAGYAEERELAERAGLYARICVRHLATPPEAPRSAVECYRHGVVLANQGRHDEALRLFDQALTHDPLCVDYLYARASAFALKGTTDRAVADLRQAILVDRTVRFQAANDPDFQGIRQEPAFIDIIEPTPVGG